MIAFQHAMVTSYLGDNRAIMQQMEPASVQTCITSPPYFGLRDYGVAGQIGLEQTPAEYVAAIVAVMREVSRVLRDDGSLWLNIGDSYAGSGKGGNPEGSKWSGFIGNKDREASAKAAPPIIPQGMKAKDLMMIPARVAIALCDDGWYLRSDIIWSKPNPMPESVTDRPTNAHEHIFLLAKKPKYFYDADAIKEPARDWGTRDRTNGKYHNPGTGLQPHSGLEKSYEKRNKRSVWEVATQPYNEAHFATFPPKLIEPCVLAGSKPGDVVLDPFGGSGTTAMVATEHQRRSVLIELNPEYVEIQKKRLKIGQQTIFEVL